MSLRVACNRSSTEAMLFTAMDLSAGATGDIGNIASQRLTFNLQTKPRSHASLNLCEDCRVQHTDIVSPLTVRLAVK